MVFVHVMTYAERRVAVAGPVTLGSLNSAAASSGAPVFVTFLQAEIDCAEGPHSRVGVHMPPAPPAFRSGSSIIRGGHVSQSMPRKQVALARSADRGSLGPGLVWIFLTFSGSSPFVPALADVTMGTITSADAYMAKVKNRVADFLMRLS
jgi:hypothetical protein